MPQGWARASADSLAARVASGDAAEPTRIDPLAAGGDLVHVATAVRNPSGQITGVVVTSEYLSGEFAAKAREMSKSLRGLPAAAGA